MRGVVEPLAGVSERIIMGKSSEYTNLTWCLAEFLLCRAFAGLPIPVGSGLCDLVYKFDQVTPNEQSGQDKKGKGRARGDAALPALTSSPGALLTSK